MLIQPPIVISGNRFKARSYVWIGRDEDDQVYEVPVYAPVDSTLTGITFHLATMTDERGISVDLEQYVLSFEVSCEVSYGYDHISRLAEKYAALSPATASRTTRDAERQVSEPVKAGELIGYTTGTAAAHNWDFVFTNSSRGNEFVNQERYEHTGDLQRLLAGDCPYDYYGELMKIQYYALLSGGPSGRIEGESCQVSHDVPGTISGGWFREPFSTETSHPHIPGWALAVGSWAGGQVRINSEETAVWVSPGQPTYADPRGVTTEHCYEHAGRPDEPAIKFVYLKLVSDTEIAVVFGEGGCPPQLPEGFQVYYR